MSALDYKKGIVDCTVDVDTSKVKGKTVIITGGTYSVNRRRTSLLTNNPGAKGMGEQAVRAFAKAGYVCTRYLNLAFEHHRVAP
jgi:hypothetical protein